MEKTKDDYRTKMKISTNKDKFYKRQYERLTRENLAQRLELTKEVYTFILTSQQYSTNLYLKLFNQYHKAKSELKEKEEEENFYLNQAVDIFISARQNGRPFMTIITRGKSTPTVDIDDIDIDDIDIDVVIDEAINDAKDEAIDKAISNQQKQNESDKN